ncbi:MAG: hypothetical protein ACRCZI_05485 [Cetobacterium sp.]
MILAGTPQGIGAYQPIGRYSDEATCLKFRDYVESEMKKAYGKEVAGYGYKCLPIEE